LNKPKKVRKTRRKLQRSLRKRKRSTRKKNKLKRKKILTMMRIRRQLKNRKRYKLNIRKKLLSKNKPPKR